MLLVFCYLLSLSWASSEEVSTTVAVERKRVWCSLSEVKNSGAWPASDTNPSSSLACATLLMLAKARAVLGYWCTATGPRAKVLQQFGRAMYLNTKLAQGNVHRTGQQAGATEHSHSRRHVSIETPLRVTVSPSVNTLTHVTRAARPKTHFASGCCPIRQCNYFLRVPR